MNSAIKNAFTNIHKKPNAVFLSRKATNIKAKNKIKYTTDIGSIGSTGESRYKNITYLFG